MAWHPSGHLLATASHDCILKFWCREPPGSKLEPQPNEVIQENPPNYLYGPILAQEDGMKLLNATKEGTTATTNSQQAISQPTTSSGNPKSSSGHRDRESQQSSYSNVNPRKRHHGE